MDWMPFCLNTNKEEDVCMWYFAWVLGVGFAVLLAILNAMWGENEQAREASRGKKE
jgi:cytochrome bd-I ubiquinol oxidase subunit X